MIIYVNKDRVCLIALGLCAFEDCTKMFVLCVFTGDYCAKCRNNCIKILGIDKNIMWCYNIAYLPMLWHNYAYL